MLNKSQWIIAHFPLWRPLLCGISIYKYKYILYLYINISKVLKVYLNYIWQCPKHVQNDADLSTDTKLITMSVYKGFPSKSCLPVLKRYSQRNLLQSIGFMAGNRVKKISSSATNTGGYSCY